MKILHLLPFCHSAIPDSQPQQVIARLASLEQEDDIGAMIRLLLPS